VLGQTARIDCNVTQLSTVWWDYQSLNEFNSVSIYNGRSKVRNTQIEDYEIHNSTDAECNFVSFVWLDVVQLEHGGTFRCTDSRDDTKKILEHELGVLGESKSCFT